MLLLCLSVYCSIGLPSARSCAVWDDNNKDSVCTPSIPAGLKCPPPSKTISLIIWFEAHLNTLCGEDSERALGKVFGLQAWDPVRQCYYIGWRTRRNKAEELRTPSRRAKNLDYRRRAKRHHPKESWIDEIGRRSDPTRNETPRPTLRTPGTGVEATPKARGSS